MGEEEYGAAYAQGQCRAVESGDHFADLPIHPRRASRTSDPTVVNMMRAIMMMNPAVVLIRGDSKLVPKKPRTTDAGSSVTETIVSTFMMSLVRCATCET